eukprot:1224481-Rhodomonas_salina.10
MQKKSAGHASHVVVSSVAPSLHTPVGRQQPSRSAPDRHKTDRRRAYTNKLQPVPAGRLALRRVAIRAVEACRTWPTLLLPAPCQRDASHRPTAR